MILSLTTKGFSPLTYDEIIAPLKTYTDEYNTVADKLAQIQTNSSFGDYADALKGDSSAYSTKLTNFENKLSTAADELSKYGISKVNRTSLIDLKKEYNNEVAPIIAAAKQKKKILDKLNVYNLSRPDKGTMVLSSMDLSNWINDPEYVPKIISVKDNIYSPTKSIVEAWSKEFEPRTYLKPMENGQMTKYIEKGFPQETINGISDFFTNGTSGNEQLDTQLHTVINNVLDSIGYSEDTFKDLDPMKQKQIMSSIAQAFNDGISKSSGINASIGRNPSIVFPTAAQLYGSARSDGSSSGGGLSRSSGSNGESSSSDSSGWIDPKGVAKEGKGSEVDSQGRIINYFSKTYNDGTTVKNRFTKDKYGRNRLIGTNTNYDHVKAKKLEEHNRKHPKPRTPQTQTTGQGGSTGGSNGKTDRLHVGTGKGNSNRTGKSNKSNPANGVPVPGHRRQTDVKNY